MGIDTAIGSVVSGVMLLAGNPLFILPTVNDKTVTLVSNISFDRSCAKTVIKHRVPTHHEVALLQRN